MRIAVCIPCLLTGGTEVQTLALVRCLVALGHRVTTICYFEAEKSMTQKYVEAGSQMIRLTSAPRPKGALKTMILLVKTLIPVLRSVNPDIVHVQYMAPGLMPVVISRLMGIKTIATVHTESSAYRTTRHIRLLNRWLSVPFQCVSLSAEQSFFGTGTVLREHSRVQSHYTVYNCLPQHIDVTERHRLYGTQLTVGVVSRLEGIKGMDLVLPAVKDMLGTSLRLMVVGDGVLRGQMMQRAMDQGVGDYVRFIGSVPAETVQDYYDMIDILLMPSRSEGFGLTAIEGMARGCVVVAADVGGLAEIVKHGHNGLLFHAGDTEDLSAKIKSLIESEEMMLRLSANALDTAKRYTYDRYMTSIDELYGRWSR